MRAMLCLRRRIAREKKADRGPHGFGQVARLIWGLSVVVLCGCASSKNISELRPFSDYVGKTVPLRRPMKLVKESRGFWSASSLPRLHVSPYVMQEIGASEKNKSDPAEKSIELAAGQLVEITKVCDEVNFDAASIIAYGTVTPPHSTERLTFAYGWGFFWQLSSAPWEPEGTPPVRKPPGKLPPHWDYEMFRAPADAPTWGEPGIRE